MQVDLDLVLARGVDEQARVEDLAAVAAAFPRAAQGDADVAQQILGPVVQGGA